MNLPNLKCNFFYTLLLSNYCHGWFLTYSILMYQALEVGCRNRKWMTRTNLRKNKGLFEIYVYQKTAWVFSKKREEVEGRFVPKERFINAFFQSRKNLMRVKKQFQEKVIINILVKDSQNTISDFLMDIDNVELVLPISYTKERLEGELHD